MKKLKVGFIGLGLMGLPMAKNILKAGFPLVVYNRTRSKTKELEGLGAKVAQNPSELAKDVDVIITMVTGPKEVEGLIFGKQGIVAGIKSSTNSNRGSTPKVVVDMSTIGPQAAVKIFSQLGKRDVDFLDAPVTGSTPKAITGELTIFIGGKPEVFQKVRPVLASLGDPLFIGKSGQGQAIKMVNNMIVAISMAALAEGMLLADAEKLPRSKVAEVLENVPALSPFQKLKLSNMVNKKHPTLFSVANMAKDLKLARSEINSGSPKLPFLTRVASMYKQAQNKGLASQDISAILEVMKN
ncbi:hypothetical protein A2631_04425 [Candidatus Daviesbacteria bacterium RIFCSPHIGHO2_01_FULL_44_29]|uniref:6-phosphogluconate dehydrogenase n=1 Tax=Candidatus Daviesbacteria bacterium RIFCSPHIGHO2_02_FULL_43_12 TaxID=1797776 RepID=A0A1F5KGG0_9BACT|nr:MAG: hypothetical protein A2631_04425 [Candidatus Daviesbacteria bacterium RIFCSPHIGHO2_01_FULL_44_29]OGE39640.1 MAG: hypothetical protein A3E86_03485 [Candidatus Daviesbacteria bacterium RIFCSPHIGHO2_12_FULL_47_45]OGE39968.1 MAG: hypothetical protein A3D25_04155 [Candidatus Daviesbacteria bacterium RIFCSPHIGHO2_02_FULL_43_12]OGE70351.1 MAG: hypothetical protein A3B55_01415 [Candidatus Daviesbacteria bacterium RIFCSPLOWO2_01_FULL_43_15]